MFLQYVFILLHLLSLFLITSASPFVLVLAINTSRVDA